MSKSKKTLLFIDTLLLCCLVFADQLTKYYAHIKLKNQPAYSVIDGVLEFNYLENRGAAFGLLQNQRVLFIFIGVIFLAVIIYILIKTPDDRKYALLHVLLIIIASGAGGNMIDRIRYGYVIDFIYFIYINFPIFNVADVYVTVASFIFLLLFLFYYKEEDLNFLNFKQNKYRQLK